MFSCFGTCFGRVCPCFNGRKEASPPLDHYTYDDEDNLEFENLLAQQDTESLAAFLSHDPFQRAGNNNGYSIIKIRNPRSGTPDLLSNLFDIGSDESLQTQDAQFLPDEQINKFTEELDEQVSFFFF